MIAIRYDVAFTFSYSVNHVELMDTEDVSLKSSGREK